MQPSTSDSAVVCFFAGGEYICYLFFSHRLQCTDILSLRPLLKCKQSFVPSGIATVDVYRLRGTRYSVTC